MSLKWPDKDPDEVADFSIDWSARLDGDTISTSTWSVTSGSGLVIDSNSKTNSITTAWLSAGVLGTAYALLNRIVTAGGRTYDQTVQIKIKSK